MNDYIIPGYVPNHTSDMYGWVNGFLKQEPWIADAACGQTNPEAHFPDKGDKALDAKKVCAGCDVREQCLDYALRNNERFGVWGGLSERERARILNGTTTRP